jgi:hypothetical protein
MGAEKPKADLLPGTLDMMVLPASGIYEIGHELEALSAAPAVFGRA